jgi:hypothetical protein
MQEKKWMIFDLSHTHPFLIIHREGANDAKKIFFVACDSASSL